jgi:glutamate---cysteine ligase / carboxylate-amine ligase
MDFEDLTIGVEEEYQIIDPHSRELTSYISEMLDQGAMIFRDQVKPEFLQSQLEAGTNICRNVKEARAELTRLRTIIAEIADKNDRKIIAAGTHPFSRWPDRHRKRSLQDPAGQHANAGAPLADLWDARPYRHS